MVKRWMDGRMDELGARHPKFVCVPVNLLRGGIHVGVTRRATTDNGVLTSTTTCSFVGRFVRRGPRRTAICAACCGVSWSYLGCRERAVLRPRWSFSEADGLLTAAASPRRDDWGPWDLGILHRPPVLRGAPEGRSTAAGFDVYEEPALAACEIYPLGGAMQGSRPFVVAAGHACTLYEVHLDMPQLQARGSSSSK